MLLLDGHNLIGRAPGLSLEREEEAREALLRRLAAAKGSGGEEVTVVFDGNRPGAAKSRRFGGVQVVFSPGGVPADEEILRRLGKINPRETTVVTSDRWLATRSRERGARVESCEVFWNRLTRRRRSNPRPEAEVEATPEEVEQWLHLFEKGRGKHKI